MGGDECSSQAFHNIKKAITEVSFLSQVEVVANPIDGGCGLCKQSTS